MPCPHISVVYNPAARGERARFFKERLRQLGSDIRLRPTRGPGDARHQAAEALREGSETIVAAGGDGTVNEVLNGITDVPGGLQQARLAVLPIGTINVFAKELQVPMNLDDAWQVACTGEEHSIDLPFAEFNVDGTPTRRYWIQLAGAGFDARAVENVDWSLKKRIGALAYVWAGIRAMATRLPSVTVQTATQRFAGQVILLGNGRYYGGRWPALPRASLTDGRFDVAILDKATWLQLARAAWHLSWDQFDQMPGVIHVQSEEITLECPESVGFQLDGEWAGRLPARFRLLPRGIRVITPRGTAFGKASAS